jgi:hypothetical protein
MPIEIHGFSPNLHLHGAGWFPVDLMYEHPEHNVQMHETSTNDASESGSFSNSQQRRLTETVEDGSRQKIRDGEILRLHRVQIPLDHQDVPGR